MPNEDQESHPSQFSLFEGDLLNRAFGKLGLGPKKPLHIIGRILITIGITWVPMAILSFFGPDPDPQKPGTDFFLDFAAYAQFFVGIPLYIIAERIISEATLGAARDFDESGVVAPEDCPKLIHIEENIAHLRKRWLPEIICLAACLYMGVWALGVEMFWRDTHMATWHSYKIEHPVFTHMMTPAAWYAMFIALPIQSYFWVRWVWKIGLWYWYLRKISQFKLVLVASHPDHTGGISFLSEVQSKFAIIILAYGISSVVATVGYKIAVEHAPVDLPPIWGMVLGFTIGAPVLFLAPLLLFTKQLARTKKRAMNQFRERAMAAALRVEEQWLNSKCYGDACDEKARGELSQLNLLSGFYERINGMRVVPFDLKSAGQLFGSAVTPVVPLLPYFVKLPEPWQAILEAMTKWLPH